MLAYIICGVIFVVTLIAAVKYFHKSPRKPSTVPGLDPVTKEDGNFSDIAKAGSLHKFLVQLHKQFGPIASFWYGPTYTVSIADANMFKQHIHVFDRPPALFQLFKPLFGQKSIAYANGTDWKNRREMYDKSFTHDANKKYYQIFQELADDIAKKWEGLAEDEHIPTSQFMLSFALKSAQIALFGETMKNEKELHDFATYYNQAWGEMELRLTQPPTEIREKNLQEAKKKLCEKVKEIVEHRRKFPPQHGEELMIDLMMDLTDDIEHQNDDAISYTIGGFHTTGNMLTWAFYFLGTHPDVQEKVHDEIKTVLGDDDVDHTNIGELVYLRQVVDETLRCAIVAPWTTRFQDVDSELGGHKIPKYTPVFHALGVACMDEKVWPEPTRFDPDRFSKENMKNRPNLTFMPFGFAGKRVCPGQRFAYSEGTVALVTLLRKFKIHLVEGQAIEPVHGLVTHPSDEVWITVTKR